MNEYFQKKILKYKNIKICQITGENEKDRRNHSYHGAGSGVVLIAIVPADVKRGLVFFDIKMTLRA